MLRLISIYEQTTDHVTFRTEEVSGAVVAYIVYDTGTGVSINLLDDYPAWRSTGVETSTGSGIYEFIIDNTDLYAKSFDIND